MDGNTIGIKNPLFDTIPITRLSQASRDSILGLDVESAELLNGRKDPTVIRLNGAMFVYTTDYSDRGFFIRVSIYFDDESKQTISQKVIIPHELYGKCLAAPVVKAIITPSGIKFTMFLQTNFDISTEKSDRSAIYYLESVDGIHFKNAKVVISAANESAHSIRNKIIKICKGYNLSKDFINIVLKGVNELALNSDIPLSKLEFEILTILIHFFANSNIKEFNLDLISGNFSESALMIAEELKKYANGVTRTILNSKEVIYDPNYCVIEKNGELYECIVFSRYVGVNGEIQNKCIKRKLGEINWGGVEILMDPADNPLGWGADDPPEVKEWHMGAEGFQLLNFNVNLCSVFNNNPLIAGVYLDILKRLNFATSDSTTENVKLNLAMWVNFYNGQKLGIGLRNRVTGRIHPLGILFDSAEIYEKVSSLLNANYNTNLEHLEIGHGELLTDRNGTLIVEENNIVLVCQVSISEKEPTTDWRRWEVVKLKINIDDFVKKILKQISAFQINYTQVPEEMFVEAVES